MAKMSFVTTSVQNCTGFLVHAIKKDRDWKRRNKTVSTHRHYCLHRKSQRGLPWWLSGLKKKKKVYAKAWDMVQPLIWEDPTRHGTIKPICHNYWDHVPKLLKPIHLEPCSQQNKPTQWEAHTSQLRVAPTHCKRKPSCSNCTAKNKDPEQPR